jgi:hypothetical protein
MSLLTLATGLFVELAQQLEPRSSRRNSGSQPAKAPGALSDLPNGSTGTPGTSLGTLFYLIPFGVVATATAVVFFGLAFFLLAHPSEGVTVDPGARDRGVEIEHRRPDPAPSPGKNAAPSTLQTPVRSVFPEKPPEAPDVSPPPRKGTTLGSAWGADTVAANATFDGSSSQDQPGLRSNTDEAAVAMPAGIADAKRAGIGRHRHAGARKQWAGIPRVEASSRPPPAISEPENASPSRAVSHRRQQRRSRSSDGSEAEVQQLNRAQLGDR